MAKRKTSARKTAPRKRKPGAGRRRRKAASRRASPHAARRRRKPAPRRWRRLLRLRVWLTALLVVALAWTAWLDFRIRHEFEGKRWALPATVYGRPLELYAGQRLTPAQFRAELERLDYRLDRALAEPGTFRRARGRFRLHKRPFRFSDGSSPARRLEIGFDGGRIDAVRDLDTGRAVDLVRLEPPRIGGIYPAHREDRILIRLDQAPRALREGIIAVEDRRFREHFGINPRAIARALWANLRAGATVQGGSTITQQLVKNFFLSNRRSLWRKANEAVMAILLEWHYDKDAILEAYLNEIYLGQDGDRAIHGFGLASRFYFDREVDRLTLPQIATLIALVRGPSWYDPRRHPDRLLERRNLVLRIMAEQGVIEPARAREAARTGLGIRPGRLAGSRWPAFVDLVRRQLQRDYRSQDLSSEGLRIFTTFDPLVQVAAERALAERLQALDRARGLEGRLQGAVVVTDTRTGEVLAVVGDRNPRYPGFNRALDAVRPIGSLIKPAIYLTALRRSGEYTLSTAIDDGPIRIQGPDGKVWSPRNYDGRSHGTVPLFEALIHSYNQATVRLGMTLGFEAIADTLERLGATREVPAYPSMLLGAVGFTPYEMAGLYQTLAAGGFRTPLRAIREVTTAEGVPLGRYPLDVEQTLDPAPVAALVSALREVTRSGTARWLRERLPDLDVAGKTGTTDDLRDSWFAGFSGDHLAVVWLGRDDNRPIRLSGSSGALRVWGDLFAALPTTGLLPPASDDVEYHWIDAETGLLADAGCPGAVELAYVRGTAPAERADCAAGTRPAGDDGAGPFDWLKRLFR